MQFSLKIKVKRVPFSYCCGVTGMLRKKVTFVSCAISFCWFLVLLVFIVAITTFISFKSTPIGCSFGNCDFAGVISSETFPESNAQILTITSSFEDGEEWKYFTAEFNSDKDTQTIVSSNVKGNICLGESSIVKPRSCNIPDIESTYSNVDSALMCFGGSRIIVIGVKNEDSSLKAQEFSFTLQGQNPYNSMAGLGCGIILIFFIICPIIVIILVWILPLICCTCILIFCTVKRRKTFNSHKFQQLREIYD